MLVTQRLYLWNSRGLSQMSKIHKSIFYITVFCVSLYLYIYAFSRCFYPKRLTVHSGCTFVLSVCVFPVLINFNKLNIFVSNTLF